MKSRVSLNLDDVPNMTRIKTPELHEIRRILARTKASEITDDMLFAIGRAVEVNLGPVPQVNRDIITRLNTLLIERRSFQFGKKIG